MDLGNTSHGHYPEHMRYTTGNPDSNEVRGSKQQRPEAVGRKSARWNEFEHRIFVATVDLAVAEGHRSGKCFTTKGWERIRFLFNREAGKNWTVSQLKNHWNFMQKEHKLLFELLNCTGVEIEFNHGNRIQASEQWWENKIQENYKYGKFKDRDCGEIYKTYSRLFGEAYNSSMYAVTPTKMAQRGLGLGPESDEESPHDTLPTNAEGTDSNDGPTHGVGNCSMEISNRRSGDKRKGKQAKEKSKKKRFGAREVTASLEQIASIGNNIQESVSLASGKQTITIKQCMDELLETGLVEVGGELHLFALWYLSKADNRNSFHAAETPELKLKWITYCFNRDQKHMAGRR